MGCCRLAFFLALTFPAAAGMTQAQSPALEGSMSLRINGIDLRAIPGEPLTGQSNVEWMRQLPDGSAISVHEISNLARDNEGRMYRELRTFVPLDSDREAPLKQKIYFDPIAKTKTVCEVQSKQCTINDYVASRTQSVFAAPENFESSGGNLVRENLGNDEIEGMSVIGMRETTTIAPGVLGNSSPLNVIRELWYADTIQTNMIVMRSDPREGNVRVRLTNVVLGEPDPQTFALPEGYNVTDARRRPITAVPAGPSN